MKFTTHLGLHSQAIRLCEHASCAARCRSATGLSPSLITCSKVLVPTGLLTGCLEITSRNASVNQPDFQLELFPLHSPLLGESLLVSFPPRNNMLKFRGYPRFISGQIVIRVATYRRSVTTHERYEIERENNSHRLRRSTTQPSRQQPLASMHGIIIRRRITYINRLPTTMRRTAHSISSDKREREKPSRS